jgi:arylsulfatase A-like enzyme
MYISFLAPHDPRTMPEEFLRMYDPDEIELPANFMPEHPFDNGEMTIRDEKLEAWPRTEEAIRKHTAEYYAMITHVDARIGEVIGKLKEQGEYENTIIVFAGDNGLAVGRHGLMGKQSVYDHSVHVPLIFAGPGIPQGEKRDAFAYLLDIFPTLCDLTGSEIPETVEGKSLVPAMADNDSIRENLFFAYTSLHRGIRDCRYKLIEYNVEGQRTTQLFDLQKDPWEVEDLSEKPEMKPELERLRKELLKWKDETDDDHPDFGEKFWESAGS